MNTEMTLAYYNDPQNHYAESTLKADMSDGYSHYLKYLPASVEIMDLGCGSGRDSLSFINNGFQVTPIDGSEKMCDEATKLIGYKVQHITFQQLDYADHFDGVWACASLLHASVQELPDILRRVATAMKPNGVLYASWKYGDLERIDSVSNWFFCDMNEERVTTMIKDTALFDLVEMWLSTDVRAEYKSQTWINIIARKKKRKVVQV